MEKCYEYFACSKSDCVMFSEKSGKPCWEVPNTLCSHDLVDMKMYKKLGLNKCNSCMYYKLYFGNGNPIWQ